VTRRSEDARPCTEGRRGSTRPRSRRPNSDMLGRDRERMGHVLPHQHLAQPRYPAGLSFSLKPLPGDYTTKKAPGTRTGALSRWIRLIWRKNELKTPQTLRSYPKAQIRQAADRVSAPDPPAGPPIDGSGLATSAQEERGASWPTGQRQHLSPGSVRRIAISLWQRCAPTRHTSRESRERKSGKWLVRQQPERKENHRNGQRRANHEQRREFSKLSATHEMQRQR